MTIVEPGYFRLSFLWPGSLRLAAHPLQDYALARESEAYHREHVLGNQPGDPARAAAVIIRIAGEPTPPLHLLLGQDAYDLATATLGTLADEFARRRDATVSTGYATAAA